MSTGVALGILGTMNGGWLASRKESGISEAGMA